MWHRRRGGAAAGLAREPAGPQWLIPFLVCWGFWGIALGVATGVPIRREAIRLAEALRWAKGDMRRRWRYGAGFGLPISFVFALLGWLSVGPAFGIGFGLGAALTVGLFFGLIGCVIGGVGQVEVQTKTQPNQGIWRSLRYAVVPWLVTGAAVATVVGLGIAVVFGSITGVIGGPAPGVASGLIAALGFGLSH